MDTQAAFLQTSGQFTQFRDLVLKLAELFAAGKLEGGSHGGEYVGMWSALFAGKDGPSILWARLSWVRMQAPRGPHRVLWVVKVIT